MARIRTVKPEFWTDKKISELSHSAALFFIGTWNFCDDEGKFILDSKQMSLRMPIFRSKDIAGWLSDLSRLGLIQVSQDSAWGLVTNWNHQKINRPIPVNIKASEIQWFPIGHSLNKQDLSVSKQRKDRIGSIGSVVPNSSQRFDSRFSPEFQTLKSFFDDNKLGNLNYLVPNILTRFGNLDTFDNWYKGLVGSKTFPKDQDFANQSRYISTSLKRELGLIPSEAAHA